MREVSRRSTLKLLAAVGAAACDKEPAEPAGASAPAPAGDPVRSVEALGSPPWKTIDPFLFCVHHDDRYPAGNADLGPAASLDGRRMGRDFEGKDGWRMYHGRVVPGFPQHPHRGFETVTVVRRGWLDHSDSLGAAARYGNGDVQWLTAGRGISHAEMFPLLSRDANNPVELFQIWLNLPRARKMVEPRFAMLWSHTIPRLEVRDSAGALTRVTLHAGGTSGLVAPAPPTDSWAAAAEGDVAIWTIAMAASARWTIPPAKRGSNRTLYFFRGSEMAIAGRTVAAGQRVELGAEHAIDLENGASDAELLLLQGRPLSEPIARHGPFVMNTQAEIEQAYADYRRSAFGGWPWDRSDPVHGREEGRFARHADGTFDRPT